MEGKRGTSKIENRAAVQRHLRRNVFALRIRSIPSTAARISSGFRSALTRSINNFASSTGMLKEQKDEVSTAVTDVSRRPRGGHQCCGCRSPSLKGQTKSKLNSDIKGDVEQLVNERLGDWFGDSTVAGRHYRECIEAARAREAAAVKPAS